MSYRKHDPSARRGEWHVRSIVTHHCMAQWERSTDGSFRGKLRQERDSDPFPVWSTHSSATAVRM